MARDLEEASLMFLKSCFDYNPTGRPKSRFVDKSFFGLMMVETSKRPLM